MDAIGNGSHTYHLYQLAKRLAGIKPRSRSIHLCVCGQRHLAPRPRFFHHQVFRFWLR
jgi:hypothetical protein